MSYYLFINGEVRGPYSKRELQDMITHREVKPDTLTSEGEGSQWTPLNHVLEINLETRLKPGILPQQPTIEPRSGGSSVADGINARQDSGSIKPYSYVSEEYLQPSKTKLWQVAAGLVIAYVLLIVVSTLFYRWWKGESDDPKSIIRMFVRAIGCVFLAHGLISTKNWAYWTALILSFLVSAFGIAGFSLLYIHKGFSGLPYPEISMGIAILTIAITTALSVVLLILPLRERK